MLLFYLTSVFYNSTAIPARYAFKAAGCPIVLISHELNRIIEVCDEAIWLDRGRLVAQGPPEEVVEQYVLETEEAPPQPELGGVFAE